MFEVSIVIPYKNNINFIFNTLDSINRQTFTSYEVIIVYDDQNLEDYKKIKNYLIDVFKINKFKIIINQKNLGAGDSRNIGISEAKGNYVAFIDSDDEWLNEKLEIQLAFMKKHNLKFSHTSYFIVDENSKKISFRKAQDEITYNNLKFSCDIGLSTVIVEKKFLDKNNFKFPNISTKEDYVLWLLIINKIKKFKGLDLKLTNYRKKKNSLSSNVILGLKNGYLVYRKYQKFNPVKSIYYLIFLCINFFKKKIKYDFNNNYKL